MTSSEVATTGSQVPDLVRPSASQITAEDISLSKIYVGQFITKAVTDELVKAGDIFAATGQDDNEPQVLVKKGAKEGLRFHVLGLRKGRSLSVKGQKLRTFAFDDPEGIELGAGVTYTYTVALPDVDPDVPFTVLFKRSGSPAARKINTVIMKHQISGPQHEVAFELTSSERESDDGKYYVPQVRQLEARPDDVATAAELAELIGAAAQSAPAPRSQPEI